MFSHRIMHVVTRKHLSYGILCGMGVLTAGFWQYYSEPYTNECTSIARAPTVSGSAEGSGGACFGLISIWGIKVFD